MKFKPEQDDIKKAKLDHRLLFVYEGILNRSHQSKSGHKIYRHFIQSNLGVFWILEIYQRSYLDLYQAGWNHLSLIHELIAMDDSPL
jgi:hypothetical protein